MRKITSLVVASALAITVGFLPQGSAGALAAGQTITFGEDPTSDTSQYVAIGVTFGGGSCCINEGISNGDSGNWGLEGTNDPYFLGFNGPYTEDVTLDESVASVSLDVSRSNGSTDGDVTLEALLGTTVVDTANAVLGDINTWSTLTVTGPMDGFRITGNGTDFHPFGVDNIVIAGANTAPIAAAGTDQSAQLVDGSAVVTLDGTGSSDADSDPLTYTWTGDFTGGSATGASPQVTFTTAGTHTVVLVVSDGVETDTDSIDVVVAASAATPPPAAPAAEPVAATPRFTG